MNEEDLLCQQFGNFKIGETSGTDSLCYLTVTDENTIFIKINNNDEAFKPIYCSLVYGKEDINGHVVDSQEVLDVEKCTCNLPSNNHDDNNAKFQIKVGSGKFSNELNTFLIITISNNKGAFEDEEGINRVETSKFISMIFALLPNYDTGVCRVTGFCVANKYFTTLPDSVQHWFLLKPKRGLENVERGKHKKNEKGYNVVMEEDTPFENLEDEQEYEKMVVEEFRYECSECLKLIRGFDGLLLENQTLFEFKYLTSVVNKSSSVSDALKLAVPSKFLANNIGNISSSHKDVPLHFVVKALIFKNDEKEECSACILFGKWLVKYESGLVVMEQFQNDTNLIYSTDIFRVDANHNGYNEDLLNTFIYKFAQFCCWWNGLGRDEINSFHFIYSLIKYLDLEENLTKNDDLLIPYIQNIVVYGGFTLCYYPTNEFISTIRELIKNKGIINNESWEHFHKTLLKDTKPVIEFYETDDVDSYISFIEHYYPDYLHQSKRSLGILRNIIISNISKFNDLNKESVEKYSSLAGNSIKRIKYVVGRSSVIDGRFIPEEFKASEELLEKYIPEYCKRVTKFK